MSGSLKYITGAHAIRGVRSLSSADRWMLGQYMKGRRRAFEPEDVPALATMYGLERAERIWRTIAINRRTALAELRAR